MKISKKQLSWSTVLVILFVQAPHLANEFAVMSQLPSDWLQVLHGIIFAIAIDYAVYIFAIQGRVWQTVLFMIASFVITLNYYQDYLVFEDPLVGGTAVMISALGVLSVFFLSHEVKRSSSDEGDSKPKWADERRGLLDKIAELNKEKQTLDDLIIERDQYKELVDIGQDKLDNYKSYTTFSPLDVNILRMRSSEKDTSVIAEKLSTEGVQGVTPEYVDETIRKFRTLYINDHERK